MSTRPFFPSLKPSMVHSAFITIEEPIDEECELQALEKQHREWLNEVSQVQLMNDVQPIGKELPELEPESEDDEDNHPNTSDDSVLDSEGTEETDLADNMNQMPQAARLTGNQNQIQPALQEQF